MTDSSPNPLWLAAGGLLALAAAIGVGRFVYTPILPLMVEGLGMSQTTAGALASANFAGYLAGALASASSVIRGSRRTRLLLALAVSALTTGAMGLAQSTVAFFLLRFAGGFASAFVLVFASALVLDRLGELGRPKLSAVHFAGVGTGIAASAILVSTVLVTGGTWRALWIGSGLLSCVCLAATYFLIPDRSEPARQAARAESQAIPALRRLVIAYGLFGFGYVITATFLVAIIRGSETMRSAEPVAWLLVGCAGAPSIAAWGFVARRIGNPKAFALACLLEAAGVIASVLGSSVPTVVVSAVLLGGTFMGLTALGLIEARRLSSGDPRRSLAVMTAAFGLGQILGPAVAGAMRDMTGSFTAPSLGAATALLLAAVLVLVPVRPTG